MPDNASIVTSLKTISGDFKQMYIDNASKLGITESEKHWMEELSKIYLCAELHIELPEHADEAFHEQISRMTEFGHDSALVTRLILYSTNIVRETDFLTNTDTYIKTLEDHKEHWKSQFEDADRAHKNKRPIESFMKDYFEKPSDVSELELSYHLTLYFKHFYRLLWRFVLFYIKQPALTYYGSST